MRLLSHGSRTKIERVEVNRQVISEAFGSGVSNAVMEAIAIRCV